MKYTLYHIRGHKWGMTERLVHRLKDQGYTISDCCEFEYYDDMDVAADREKELNLKFGYYWNKQQDWRIAKKNSYKGGAANRDSGQINKIQPIGCVLGGKAVFGSKHGMSKLTEADVLEIRAKHIPYKYTMEKLAKEYGVCALQINRIIKRDN